MPPRRNTDQNAPKVESPTGGKGTGDPAAAHGVFESYGAAASLTTAQFLAERGRQTDVFVRFSTMVGSRGSADTARDVRGFAAKFHTEQGTFDLVGNNKSRSYRTIEWFGVHTFRLINAKRETSLVKFHWKPLAGVHSVAWEEAQIAAAFDPDFQRRDMAEAIEAGVFFEYELGIQVMPDDGTDSFEGIDLLDPTRLVPEELCPVQPIGKLTLNRNPTNYFAEAEQVAFHAGNPVPGLEVTNDQLRDGMSEVEQSHIVEAYSSELSKVYGTALRERQLACLADIDDNLSRQVAQRLGLPVPSGDPATEATVSEELSQVVANPSPVVGRKVGVIADAESDLAGVNRLIGEMARLDIAVLVIAPLGGLLRKGRAIVLVDRTGLTARSIEFDAVVVADGTDAAPDLKRTLLLQEAYHRCKALGAWGSGKAILADAGIPGDAPGVVIEATVGKALSDALRKQLGLHRVWDRAALAAKSNVTPIR